MILLKILLLLFVTVADIYLFRIGLLPLEPSLTLLPIATILFIFKSNMRFLRWVARQNSFRFLVALFLLSLFYLPFSSYDDTLKVAGLHLYSLIIYLIAAYVFIYSEDTFIRKFFFAGVIILALSVLLDLAGLLYTEKFTVRGSGFAANPNSAGERFLFMSIVLVFLLHKTWQKIIFLLSLGLIIFFTLSRSSILSYLIILMILMITDFSYSLKNIRITRLIKYTVIGLLIVVVALFSLPPLLRFFPGFQTDAAQERIVQMKFKSEMISDMDKGDGGRLSIFNDYIEDFLDNPFGYGTSASTSGNRHFYAPHNLYLKLGVDYGIFGIIVLLWYIVSGLRKGIRTDNTQYLLFFIIILLFSIFTHTLLDDRSFLISLAAVDVLAYRKALRENI